MVRWEVPPARRLAFVTVLALTAVSVLATATWGFQPGGYLLALAAALAGGFRAVLPPQYCLGLLVRTRRFDIALALTLALALAATVTLVPT